MGLGQKRTPFSFRLNGVVILATTYFHTGYTRTIIGDDAFHFRVRYGNGWGHVSKATRVLTLGLSRERLKSEALMNLGCFVFLLKNTWLEEFSENYV